MNWAGRYVGLPFVDGGRDRRGVDCWGLVKIVYADCLGIELPTYGEISARELRRIAGTVGDAQTTETWRQVIDPQPFDVAVMRAGASAIAAHVGVMVDARRVLHVERASSACIEDIDTPMMRHRVTGYWRHAEAA